MIVVDASAMIELLTGGANAREIAGLLDDDLFAPDLLVAEVSRCLTRIDRAGNDVEPARRAFESAPIGYVPVWPHADRIWALRHTVSAYDASYVVVAEALRCPIVTSDARLGRATGIQTLVIVATR